MKKPLAALLCFINFLFVGNIVNGQSFGTLASAVWLTNCTQDNYFNTSGNNPYVIGPAANVFTGTNLGTYSQNSGSLILRGGEVRTFKTPGVANVCGATLYYRVYPQSGTPGTFNTIDLIFSEDCDDPYNQYPSGGYCDPGNQQWNLILSDGVTIPSSPVDLTANTPGTYVLEVYYVVTGSATTTTQCDETVVLNNSGANYTAIFSIQSPTITSSNPSCSGGDGSITISGLTPNTTYSVSYTADGTPVGPTNFVSNGSGQIIITGLNAGTYSNFSLQINGCTTALATQVILVNQGTFPVNINSTNPTTCNGTEGSIIFTGLTPGATYSISYTDDGVSVGPLSFTANGSGQVTIPGLNAGLYSNFALSLSSCTTNLYIGIVLSNPIFIPTFTAIPPFCAGTTPPILPGASNNGMTGTWSPATIDNQNSGNYTFTPAAGQCGIPITISVTVTPRTTPTFPFGTSLTICGGSSVPTLPNTSTNGINGTWSPAVVDNQNSGTYTFTPNAGQCANPATFTVTVNPNITPTFSFGTSLTICAGEPVPSLPTTSGNGITGTWSPSVVDNQNSGTYTFTPNAGQCATTATFTVTVNPIVTPTFSFGASLNICAGGSVPTLPNTSTNGITGTWNPSVVDPQNSGTYTFTPDAGQCATSVTFTVTVTPNITPTFSFGTSLNICAGGSVPTLPTTSTNGINGTWNSAVVDDQNSGTYTFTPNPGQCAITTTFTVTVTPNITSAFSFGTSINLCAGDAAPALPTTSTNGITGSWSPASIDNQNSGSYTFTPDPGQCALTVTLTVTVNPIVTPVFSFGTSLNICAGGSVPTLPNTSNNGINGTWNPSVVDPQNSGTYTFTPGAGQCATSATFTVTVTPNITPTFSFGTSLTICDGGSVPTLPANSTNNITGTWNPAVVDNQNSGIYTFTPHPGQCALSATFTVTVNPILTPTFSFGNSLDICAGSTAPSLPTTSTNGITGTWSPSTIDNQNSGTYTFLPGAGQCANSTTLTVNVNPIVMPVFTIGTSLTICNGGSVPSLPNVSNNGIIGSWNPATVNNLNSGVYTFTPDPGQGTCVVNATYTVTVNQIATPLFNFGSMSICIGGTVPTLPSNSQNGISGTWSPSVIDNQNNGSYTFTPDAGQCANPLTINVTVNVVPTVNVRMDTTLNDGDLMPATYFTGTPASVVYNWTNSNPVIGLTEFGVGNVPSFVAINKSDLPITSTITVKPLNGGCEGVERNYKITVNPLSKDLFVPNVFSPNGDGKNDKLFAYGNYVDKLEMRIFNQWGEQIIFINSINQGWDGTFKGKPQPVGVYVYVLKATLNDGKVIEKKGSITLLR